MSTILVAMFSPRISSKIIFSLKKHNHNCLQASDPATMKKSILDQNIDLLLIYLNSDDDIIKTFIHEIKTTSEFKNLPIIAVTPKVSVGEIDNIFSCGVDECISPPFKISTLLNKITDLIKNGIPQSENTLIPEKLEEDFSIIKKEGRFLKDIIEVFSGASVGNHKARRMSRPNSQWTEIIPNEAVTSFHINSEREYYLMKKQFMRKIPKKESYDVKEKVLIKRTVSPLAAAIDNTACAYSNELYGIQTVKGFSCATLACILNSRYAHFYFQRYLPPKEGLKDLYLSKSDILSLPIILPEPAEQNKLDKFYHQLHTAKSLNSNSLEHVKLLNKMNQLVFDIFHFDSESVKILNSLHF